ncbi:MAG TPA: hypothetical protein VM345_05270 [Acidimicrobiales bacterium]|nr:hypothetical protein [Acidimicrobiales bacterium]
MLLACWSVKGGSGTTVVSAALSLVLATRIHDVVVADLAGDLPSTLGVAGSSPGVSDWVAAGPEVEADALGRLALDVRPLRVLPLGSTPFPTAADEAAAGAGRLVEALDSVEAVVVDAGRAETEPFAARVVAAADVSLLVVRPCYLALRRAVASSLRPTGIVLVDEPGRALTALDIEEALDVPVLATVPHRPEIARAVDAGMLSGRLPRALAAALRRAT